MAAARHRQRVRKRTAGLNAQRHGHRPYRSQPGQGLAAVRPSSLALMRSLLSSEGVAWLSSARHAEHPRPMLQGGPMLQGVVQLTASDCQRLAGVAVGGWIVVSLICGIALGATGVLLMQFLKRRRGGRYAAAAAVSALGDPVEQRRAKHGHQAAAALCMRWHQSCWAPFKIVTCVPPQDRGAGVAVPGAQRGSKALNDSGGAQLPALLPAREPVMRPPKAPASVGFSPLTATRTSVHGPAYPTPGKGAPAATADCTRSTARVPAETGRSAAIRPAPAHPDAEDCRARSRAPASGCN